MAYVTRLEHELARTRRQMQMASEGLASARAAGDPALVRAFEQHVLRMHTYVHNQQEAVARQRGLRLPRSPFQFVPYTLEISH